MREAAGLGRGVKNLQLVPVHAHRRFHVGAFIRPAVIRPRLPARPRPAPPGIARLRVQPCSLAQQGSPLGDRHRAPHEPAYSELFISHLLARKIRSGGGSGRSIVQFERETPGTDPSASCESRAVSLNHFAGSATRGRLRDAGKQSTRAPARSAGVVGTARWKGGSGNRGRPVTGEGSGLNVATGDGQGGGGGGGEGRW